MSVFFLSGNRSCCLFILFFLLLLFFKFLVYFLDINSLIDISESSPLIMRLETVVSHVSLHSSGGTIIIQEFEGSVNVVVSVLPVAGDVGLEGLSEDWVELVNVRLQANNIAVKCEHIVNTLVLKTFDINRFKLLQLYQVSNIVFIRILQYFVRIT
jgi:hypothetical protein